jgi:hypothetical protein
MAHRGGGGGWTREVIERCEERSPGQGTVVMGSSGKQVQCRQRRARQGIRRPAVQGRDAHKYRSTSTGTRALGAAARRHGLAQTLQYTGTAARRARQSKKHRYRKVFIAQTQRST